MAQKPKKCKHTILDPHCASCKTLQRDWYKKLETDSKTNPEEGFVDIERHGRYEGMLKIYSSEFYSKDYDKVVRDSKQEYYQLALNFLESYKFESNREKIIWEYHSNGISMRDISKLLKKIRVKMNRNDVCTLINRLKFSMYQMYVKPRAAQHE